MRKRVKARAVPLVDCLVHGVLGVCCVLLLKCTLVLQPCSKQQSDALREGGLAGVEEEVVDIYAGHRLTRVAFDLGLKPAVSLDPGPVFVAGAD